MYRTNAPRRPVAIAAPRQRANRLLIALAVAWMVVSLAIGGTVMADTGSDTPAAITGVTQP